MGTRARSRLTKPQFVLYETAAHVQLVKAFNARLRAGGEPHYQFPEDPVRDYPEAPGVGVHQEPILLVQEGEMRGGYILKHQKFAVRGTIKDIACGPQLPLSEGIVNPKYGMNGLLLLQDAHERQSLLFAVGMGGMDRPFPKLLKAVGWPMFPVPFYFKVLDGARFFDNIRHLGGNWASSGLLELVRRTGFGRAGIHLAQLRISRNGFSPQASPVDEFGTWADELWERSANQYSLCAVRDCKTLSALYSANRRLIRLQVTRHGETIGWAAVLQTQMSGHRYFGNMRVGSIIDCLSLPKDAQDIVEASARFLESFNLDLIVSNQANESWCRALSANGFLRGPSNYIFAMSNELAQELQPLQTFRPGIHMNRGDGDGPVKINL